MTFIGCSRRRRTRNTAGEWSVIAAFAVPIISGLYFLGHLIAWAMRSLRLPG